ncbi:hypothetical protein FRB90_011322 [Tulasnella sp. 427]|nr:hypothetical protein FRB90_011322 [Tulasnella sp. 427]
MLLFARSRLRNAALRWFAKLDASVKNDWDLFVQTMFDQYPPVASHRGKVVEALTPVCPVPSTVTLPATRPEESVEYEIEKHKKSRKESSPKSSTIAKAGKLSQTLSSALLPCYDASGFGIHIGRLRVVYEEKMPPTWIWRGTAPKNAFSKQIPTYNSSGKITLEGSTCGIKSVTLNRLDALLVTFRSEEEPHAIACPVRGA